MLGRLGAFTVRHRKGVLITAIAAFLVSGALGGSVTKRLSSGGFDDPNSEANRAEAILASTFHAGNPNLVLLVTAKGGSVDAASVANEGRALTGQIAHEPGVAQAVSYWTLGSPPPLRSRTGNQ